MCTIASCKILVMKPVLVFCLLLVTLCAQSQTNASYRIFSAERLRQDADSLYASLQANHPALYAHFPKEQADQAFLRFRQSIGRPMDRVQFMRLVSCFLARFHDGHTFLATDFEMEEVRLYEQGGGRFFPLTVTILDGKIYCRKNDTTGFSIQPGDQILRINGIAAASIIHSLAGLWSADGQRTAIISAERLFSFGLWLTYGWGNETTVTYLHKGKIRKERMSGRSKKWMTDQLFHHGQARALHLYPDYSLAVIEINEYTQVKRSNAFIDSCFMVIRAMGLQNVALDLRGNGGGNSSIGDHLLAYITSKPFLTVQEKIWRDGPLMRSVDTANWRYPSLHEVRTQWTRVAPDRYRQTFQPETADSTILPLPVHFYLFTSGRTFSSAHMTALAVKCGGLGTIIGQPTGERLDLTGEIASYKLPQSGIEVWMPTAIYRSACGPGEQVGVMPDHLVPQRVADLLAHKDPELEWLKASIGHQRAGS